MKETLPHPKLAQIVENLKFYSPEKVILYGSWARGEATPESDLDLLVIKKTRKPYYERVSEVYGLLCREEDFGTPHYPHGLDLKVYTPEEIKRELELGNFFLRKFLSRASFFMKKRDTKTLAQRREIFEGLFGQPEYKTATDPWLT